MGISVPRNLLFPSPMVVRGVNPPRLLPLGGGRPPTRGIPIQPCRPPRVKCISATATAALQCRSLPPDVPTGRPRPLPPALGRRRRRPPVGCGRRAGGGRRRRGHAVGRAHAAASRLASMAHMIGGGGGLNFQFGWISGVVSNRWEPLNLCLPSFFFIALPCIPFFDFLRCNSN